MLTFVIMTSTQVKILIITGIIFNFCPVVYLQTLNGTWKGTLYQEPQKTFYFEIRIQKTIGNKISGTTYIQNAGEAMQFGSKKGDYGTLEFNGVWNGEDVIIQETGIVQQDKSSTFYWCIKKCMLKLSKQKKEWTLKGSWHSTGGCMPGTIAVSKKVKATKDSLNLKKNDADPVKPIDTLVNIEPIPPVNTLDSVNESHQANADSVTVRKVDVKNTIYVDSSQIQLKVWDNDLMDGDIISLSLNGLWILKEHTVTKGKKKVWIKLDQKENILLLYAENLGSKPPNTAAIIVYDGIKEQKIILQSDKGKSEAIKIVRK